MDSVGARGDGWRRLVLLGFACWSLNPTAKAYAAAFQLRENSALTEGTATAGTGSAANSAATVFNNPAGITQLPGVQVELGSSLLGPSFMFQGSAVDAFGRPIAGGTERNGAGVGVVPNGYVTYRLAPDLGVGLALTSPFGEASYYGPGFVGRYQSDKTSLETIDINPAIAWQALPWLSLGAGVSADYADAEFSSALNSSSAAAAAFGRPIALSDGLATFRGNDWAFGYNFGALVTPAPGTNIGLTYRSRLQHDISGTQSFDVPLPLSLSPAFRNGPAQTKLVLPPTAGFSVTQRLAPSWTGYGELDWTNWSQFRSLGLFRASGSPISVTPEHFRNSFFVAFGASYQVTSRWAVRAGTAFDKTPVNPGYLTTILPDANRYWLAAGTSYQILPGALIDFGYAHIFVDDSSIRQLSPTGDLLTGHYTNSIDVVSLGTRIKF